jgi:hypothetical protein
MLDTPRIDLIELVLSTGREQGGSSASSAAGNPDSSIWVDEGLKFLEETGHSDYSEGILVQFSTPLGHCIFKEQLHE